MIRALLAALLALSLTWCSATNCMGGSIVYNIVNYPDLQNGYTLSGTITTDGAIGTLTSTDIIAWSFSVTGPASYQASSQDPNASVLAINVMTTATELTLAPITVPNSINEFELANEKNEIGYGRASVVLGSDGYFSIKDDRAPATWFTTETYPPGLSLGGSTWIIATVATIPEPGTLTLALLGGACIGAVHWMRRCRRAVSRSDR